MFVNTRCRIHSLYRKCVRTCWQEHLSGKLKEHGSFQDERDPCLFVNTELDSCIGVHVNDMLAAGPNELTKNLLQELSKDMTMRWCMVTDKPQEFLGRSYRKATRLESRMTA